MPQSKRKIRPARWGWFLAAAALLVAAAAAGPWPVEQDADVWGDKINIVSPLLRLAEIMQERYAMVVTYEDPVWEFVGDLEPARNGFPSTFPIALAFTVPPELTPNRTPKLDAAALARAVAAYHSQTDGPRYKVLTSRLGLHLVPDRVRGADGEFAPARNPLDTVLSMPVMMRTPTEHLAALCAEVSSATGVDIELMGPSGNYTLENIYLPNGHSGRSGPREDLLVPWGAAGITARDALNNLLEPSATSLPWSFACKTGKRCTIQVDAIRLHVAAPDGRIGATALLYDRCVTCPKLGSPPVPLIRKQ